MKLINIGFGNLISQERLVAIVSPDSAPIKRMVQETRERGMLIDATYGRKTASIFIMDSDHVILLNDELLSIAREAAVYGYLDKIFFCLDYFDASINRTAAWIIGTRNFRKALLIALLEPRSAAAAEKQFDYTGRLAAQEAAKSLPWGAVWNEFLARCDMPDDFQVMSSIRDYEKRVLAHR